MQKNFRNNKGNVAKPLRMALGALLIQKEYGYSDEETVLQIQENPCLQFFIGLPGYQDERPFDATSMVHFRKRLGATTLIEINEKISSYNKRAPQSRSTDDDNPSSGILNLDVTCSPKKIKYPTDTQLLNGARTHAEKIIDTLCIEHSWKKPLIYRRVARKVYLGVVYLRKKARNWLRAQLRKLLS